MVQHVQWVGATYFCGRATCSVLWVWLAWWPYVQANWMMKTDSCSRPQVIGTKDELSWATCFYRRSKYKIKGAKYWVMVQISLWATHGPHWSLHCNWLLDLYWYRTYRCTQFFPISQAHLKKQTIYIINGESCHWWRTWYWKRKLEVWLMFWQSVVLGYNNAYSRLLQ